MLVDSSSYEVSQVSTVCGIWLRVSILGSLFRPHLGPPPGFHSCYGSCFVNLAFHGFLSLSPFKRLVDPVLVSGGGSSRPSGGPRSLHGVRDFGETREVQFIPSQRVLYLGTVLDSRSFVASSSPDQIARLLSLGEGFLSSVQQPAACWQSLLGSLSSLTHLVPGGRLRMRSLQFQLHRNWDRVEDSTLVPWTPACRLDLRWWLDEPRLQRGVFLALVSPDLDFWSDTSDI